MEILLGMLEMRQYYDFCMEKQQKYDLSHLTSGSPSCETSVNSTHDHTESGHIVAFKSNNNQSFESPNSSGFCF